MKLLFALFLCSCAPYPTSGERYITNTITYRDRDHVLHFRHHYNDDPKGVYHE